jgi:hypothetical protein
VETYENPFVAYLNRYTTTSPEHESAFDEFITEATPPPGDVLRLKAKTESFITQLVQRSDPPSIILTGNAGDGKTYLCRQIVERLVGHKFHWGDKPIWEGYINGNGYIRVVKDLSEMGEDAGRSLLGDLVRDLEDADIHKVYVIAANEGRLRSLLRGRSEFSELRNNVDRQLREGPDTTSSRLIVLNLNKVTTSTYVPQALEWMTMDVQWDACKVCPAKQACPIRYNAQKLSEKPVQHQIQFLYKVLEHLGIHVTIRDMLIHLAYTVTGGLTCQHVLSEYQRLTWYETACRYAYYENIWGHSADENYRRKAMTINHLRQLDVGKNSVFAVDNFIVNGNPEQPDEQAAHDRLFARTLDLGDQLFIQAHSAYVSGMAISGQNFLDWLPHCRRKLFFEWSNTMAVHRLLPFVHLLDYFNAIQADRRTLERYRSDLILGLNRAFSGLYLTNRDGLYVTSQYAHAVEQPVPIVRVKIASDNVILRVERSQSEALDIELSTLALDFHPPAEIRNVVPHINWPVDLMRFEYLMRRARGGTRNVLMAECELAIRQLKDRLLSTFASQDIETDSLRFFAAERHGYVLHTLYRGEVDQ